MSDIEKSINLIRSNDNYESKNLYLIKVIDSKSAFLLQDNKIYYAIKSSCKKSDYISTTYMILKTSIFINSLEDAPSFNPDNYDVLIYDLNIDDSFLDSFVELCEAYSLSSNIKFINFFYSLLKLFEPQKEKTFTNLIGLFGELLFLRKCFIEFNANLSDERHNVYGVVDKYDFSCEDANVEIKTTTKTNMIFLIKHSQIFNKSNNYVVVFNIESDNSGMNLLELYDFFKKTSPFNKNLNFLINLEKEKKKVNPADFINKRFTLVNCHTFLNKDLIELQNIPNCITSVSYNYDFIGQKEIPFIDMINNLINSETKSSFK